MLRGRFVVFDGPDGGGKSTQFDRFKWLVNEAKLPVCSVREPGGTVVGERIRQLLLDPGLGEVDENCEMLLYMASRAQLCAQEINPALSRGDFVLADRFLSSTLVYQGALGGVPEADILVVAQIALKLAWPDLVVIFDVDEATAMQRLTGGGKRGKGAAVETGPSLFSDRMENKIANRHEKVRQAYLDYAAAHPGNYVVIDAMKDPDALFEDLLQTVEARAAQW